MTKEQLAKEIAAWQARSEHEAKLSFRDGDLIAAMIWGTKVPHLVFLEKELRRCPYETGIDVDGIEAEMKLIISRIDFMAWIREAGYKLSGLADIQTYSKIEVKILKPAFIEKISIDLAELLDDRPRQ